MRTEEMRKKNNIIVKELDNITINNIFNNSKDIENIKFYIGLYLNSNCTIFKVNIGLKSIYIYKYSDSVYRLIYHNKYRRNRFYYDRLISKNALIKLLQFTNII